MVTQQQAQPAPTETHALLPPWANGQDRWCRTIAADVLKNRVQPSDLDIDRYVRLLLPEKKLSAEAFEPVPKIEEKEHDANPLEPVDAQLPFVEIDVLILERHHLAPPQACFSASKTIK